MPGADDNKTQEQLDAEAAAAAEAEAKRKAALPGAGGKDSSIATLEDALKVIKELRTENASHRTKGKSQEDSLKTLGEQLGTIKKHLGIKDDVDPTEQISTLKSSNEELQFELSMNQLARAHNIAPEQDKYFRFLMGSKIAELEEKGKDGDELSEDAIKEVVAEVAKLASVSKQKPNNNSSSVDGKDGKKPNEGGSDEMTPEQFAKLNMGEKSAIYTKDKAQYDRLFKAAKEKRLL